MKKVIFLLSCTMLSAASLMAADKAEKKQPVAAATEKQQKEKDKTAVNKRMEYSFEDSCGNIVTVWAECNSCSQSTLSNAISTFIDDHGGEGSCWD
jgi:hypothetical protein